MQLTFRDIEDAFRVGEKTVFQWLNVMGMPAVKANDQYFFNSVEVLEWALKNRIPLTVGALKLCEKSRGGEDVFSAALMRGGVHYGLDGLVPEQVLKAALDCLPLPLHVDRSVLQEMLLSREQAGTTAVGQGIAIPHVKHPVIMAGVDPIIGLFFLKNSVNFNSPDGSLVHTLFVILSGSFKGHLSLLSRLAFCLQDSGVKAVLDQRAPAHDIMATLQIIESRITRSS